MADQTKEPPIMDPTCLQEVEARNWKTRTICDYLLTIKKNIPVKVENQRLRRNQLQWDLLTDHVSEIYSNIPEFLGVRFDVVRIGSQEQLLNPTQNPSHVPIPPTPNPTPSYHNLYSSWDPTKTLSRALSQLGFGAESLVRSVFGWLLYMLSTAYYLIGQMYECTNSCTTLSFMI